MSRSIARRRLFAPTTALSKALFASTRAPATWRAASSFPIAEASFWKSMVPKPFRRSQEKKKQPGFETWMAKEWNPATFFIIIFLLIGSMSINMIALKKDFDAFMRQSDVRIGLLREVVEKLQKGEKVDVERALGTGVPEKEMEWQDVLNEIERGDITRSQKKKQAESAPSPKVEPEPKGKEEPTNVAATQSTSHEGFF